MKTKMKLLDLVLISALFAGGAATPGFAADVYSHSNTNDLLENLRQMRSAAQAPSARAATTPVSTATHPGASIRCTEDTCSSTEDFVVHLRERAGRSAMAQLHAHAPPVSQMPGHRELAKLSSSDKKDGRAALIVRQPVKLARARVLDQQATITRKKSKVVVQQSPADQKIAAVSSPAHSAVRKPSLPMASTAVTQLMPAITFRAPHVPNPVAAVNRSVIVSRKASFRQVSGGSEVTLLKPKIHRPASRYTVELTAVAVIRSAVSAPARQTPAATVVAGKNAIIPRKPTPAQASASILAATVASPSASAHTLVMPSAAATAPVAAALHPSRKPVPRQKMPAGDSEASDTAIVPRKFAANRAKAVVATTSVPVQQQPVTDVVATHVTRATIASIVALPSTPLKPNAASRDTGTNPLATAPTPRASVTVVSDNFIEQRKSAGANSVPASTAMPSSTSVAGP